MDILQFFDAYQSECVSFFVMGIAFAFVLWFLASLYSDTCRLFGERIQMKRHAAMCLGFHSGQINGVCRNHSCPYSRQCCYHVPRRSFKVYLSDLFKKSH